MKIRMCDNDLKELGLYIVILSLKFKHYTIKFSNFNLKLRKICFKQFLFFFFFL